MLQNSLDPNHYYPSPTHEEAEARVHFLVENRRRAGLLVGASGSGKSMVLRSLAQQLKRQGGQTALVNLTGLDVDEMLRKITVQFGLNPADDLPRFAIWRLISDRICENRHQQIATVILLDDVDQASNEVALQVHRLVNVDSSPDSCVTIVFSSPLTGACQLDDRLLGYSELRIELEPWDQKDIAGYLASCLHRLGRSDVAFDSAAVSHLQQLSGGLPRRLHQLAELAILAAADQRISTIDRDTVDLVQEELSVAGQW